MDSPLSYKLQSMALLIEDRRPESRKNRRYSGGRVGPEFSQRRSSSLPRENEKPTRRGSFLEKIEHKTDANEYYGYEKKENNTDANEYYGYEKKENNSNANEYYGYEQPEGGYEQETRVRPRRRSMFGNIGGDSHSRKPRRGSFFGCGQQPRKHSGSHTKRRGSLFGNKKPNEKDIANEVLAAFCDFED